MSSALAIGLAAALAISARISKGSAAQFSSLDGTVNYSIDWGSFFAGARRLSRIFDENVRQYDDAEGFRSWPLIEPILLNRNRVLILDWIESSGGPKSGGGRALLRDVVRIARENKAYGILAISKAVDGHPSPLGFYRRMGFDVLYSHPGVDESDLAIVWLSLPIELSNRVAGSSSREPSVRELRHRAQADLDSGFCGDADDPFLYHVAPIELLTRIAAEGLRPDAHDPGFIGFQSWSKGKVFVSAGLDSMRDWKRILENSSKRSWSSSAWIPIRISLSSLAYRMIRSDWRAEIPCSFFLTRPISPLHLQVEIVGGSWVPLTVETASSIQKNKGIMVDRNPVGSRAASIFLQESDRSRIQSVASQSFTKSAILSPAKATQTALSEMRALGGSLPAAVASSLRLMTSTHKKILWVDMVKINSERMGQGLGTAAVDRMESWARSRGATLALAVSYDFTGVGSPLSFWEARGYSSIHEDDETEGQPAIIFKEL